MAQSILAFARRHSKIGAYVGSVAGIFVVTPFLLDKMTTVNDGPYLVREIETDRDIMQLGQPLIDRLFISAKRS